MFPADYPDRLGDITEPAAGKAPSLEYILPDISEPNWISRCHGAQDSGDVGNGGVDFRFGRRSAETEADRPHAHLGRDSHGLENRRQLDMAAVARGPRRGGNTIKPRKEIRANLADEGDVGGVGQPELRMPIQHNAIAEVGLQKRP